MDESSAFEGLGGLFGEKLLPSVRLGQTAPPDSDVEAELHRIKSENGLKGGSKVNTDTEHVQFECHWDFVRYYAPNKTSWDLDSKRPNVSLATEANYKCNYPDGGEVW